LGLLALGVLLVGISLLSVSIADGHRDRATAQSANCARRSVGLTPITDLKKGRYKGTEGGLYPGGVNNPPQAYLARGKAAAAKVRPLNAAGKPSSSGKIVLLSIGMSNAAYEFNTFQLVAHSLPDVNPSLVVVNGAVPSATADPVSHTRDPYWGQVTGRLEKNDVTARQVQAIWLKEAIRDEDRPYPTDADALEHDLKAIISILTKRFPNLRLVYVSSRTYGGYATTNLNPEPFAYDSGFAVKSLVASRIAKDASVRPWVAWGPYLWTDGMKGRKDGLVWTCSDVEPDGTHPSEQGRQKVANLLLSFFEHNKTSRWFLQKGSKSPHSSSSLSNIRYGTGSGEPLLLDAYVAKKPRTKRPGVILIHGGGWSRGDKETFAAEGEKLAQLGWDAFSIDYRLDPPAQFPAPIDDSLRAVRWIRAHAARFHLDPKKLAVLGSSAGGNLAALLAAHGHGPRTKGSRVLAAVTWSAPMDLSTLARDRSIAGLTVQHYVGCQPAACPKLYAEGSPVDLVNHSAAPMLIANSSSELIPLSQAKEMVTRLAHDHVTHRLIVVPGARHAEAYEGAVWKASLTFLEQYLGRLPVQDFTPPAHPGLR
jgi:acetyl esterase/lipase